MATNDLRYHISTTLRDKISFKISKQASKDVILKIMSIETSFVNDITWDIWPELQVW